MTDEVELSKAEREAIEAEVQRELDKEQKAEARKRLKDRLLAEARQKRGIDEPLEEIYIDLPPYCANLLIDNVMYQHGATYNVRQAVAMSMREQMQRCWEHQAEVDGHKKDYYRKMRETRMSGVTGAVSNGPLRA